MNLFINSIVEEWKKKRKKKKSERKIKGEIIEIIITIKIIIL